MKYTVDEVMQFVAEEDVKFIRLAFCDVFGRQKNVSVMPSELDRVFSAGLAIDASAVAGFGGEVFSDLFLHPDPDTLSVLPWRPEHGRVVRMFCSLTYPDGTPFERDTRTLLREAVKEAEKEGITFAFGPEMEFYLFKLDENGEPTKEPYDKAGYMDVAPADKGENVRREVCLTLERMGIYPESSHHEEGPGQNEIDFHYADPLTSADNAVTFRTVVETMAAQSGLYASFSPKPLAHAPGNGFHIHISAKSADGRDVTDALIAGLVANIREMTLFLDPSEESYARLGADKAPFAVSWSRENRSQLIRIPADKEGRRAELRSPDPTANPYIAFTLLIHACLDGIRDKLFLPPPADFNMYTASDETLSRYVMLPRSREEAAAAVREGDFISRVLPRALIDAYLNA